MSAKVIPFRQIGERARTLAGIPLIEDENCGRLEFISLEKRPAAKSSTGVLTAQGHNVACPKCGCRRPAKSGCECGCHRTWNTPSGEPIK